MAEISLGTPAQAFNVVIDTASSDFWIPSSQCPLPACIQHNYYNSSASSSYREDGSKFNIGDEIRGFVSRDALRMGDLQVKNALFAEVVWLRERFFIQAPFDGILGLAPKETGNSGIESPLHQLVRSKALDEPVFAFHFGNSNVANDSSELVLGGPNTAHYSGELFRFPTRHDGLWEVELNALRFGKHKIELEGTGALFRTGFSAISLPSAVADLLHMKMGAKPSLTGAYIIGCSMRDVLPDLAFVLAGHDFALSAYDYTFEYKGKCISLIIGWDFQRPRIQLGLPFFLPWYSIYNMTDGSVSLARAVH